MVNKSKAFSLIEFVVTMGVILLITAFVLFVYRQVLFSISLGNEANILYSSLKLAREAADDTDEHVKIIFEEGFYWVQNLSGDILYSRTLPSKIRIESPKEVVFTGELTPSKGATINLISANKIKKITVDPSTGRIKLW